MWTTKSDGLVKSGTITATEGYYSASLKLKDGSYRTDIFKTVFGAKQTIGRNFQPGLKWVKGNEKE
jgi:hypothetical protein